MSRLIQNLRKLKKYNKLIIDLEDNISVLEIFKNFNFFIFYSVLFYLLYYLILPTNDIIVNSDYLLLFSIINSFHLMFNILFFIFLTILLSNNMMKFKSYLLNLSIDVFLKALSLMFSGAFIILVIISLLLLLGGAESVKLNSVLYIFNFLPLCYFLCSPLFIVFFILSYRVGSKKIKLNKIKKIKNKINGKISNIKEENKKFKSNKIELIKAKGYLKTKNFTGSDIFNLNEYLDDIEINKSTEISLDNQCKLDYITNNNLLKKDIKIEND